MRPKTSHEVQPEAAGSYAIMLAPGAKTFDSLDSRDSSTHLVPVLPTPVRSAIVRQLQDRLSSQVSIVVLDVSVHTKFGPLRPGVTYYKGDICVYSHLRAAAANCACIVHTAAMISNSITKDATIIRVNEQGTRHVVEVCLERDVPNLVYTSSGVLLLLLVLTIHSP